MKRLVLFAIFIAAVFIADAQSLNVASYNVRLLTDADYKSGNGWSQRVDCLCGVIRFNDFDIFGAQEVKYEQLSDMLYRLRDYDYIGVGRDDGMQSGEYSPVFYKRDRFMLLDSGTFWLSETPEKVSKGWDAKCMRVCSWGCFKDRISRKKFWFFNLHMDHIGIVARRESARLVVKRIAEMCGKNASVILTGDFNVAQDNEIYDIFADCGFLNDSYEIAEFRFAPTGTFNNFKPQNFTTRRIDHIWVSNNARVDRYGVLTYHFWSDESGESSRLTDAPKEIKAEKRTVRLPSDHYPVNVFLSFK